MDFYSAPAIDRLSKKQTGKLGPWIFGAHERLTYKEGMYIAGTHAFDICWRMYAAFSNHDSIGWNGMQQGNGGIERGFECPQISIIDADQRR